MPPPGNSQVPRTSGSSSSSQARCCISTRPVSLAWMATPAWVTSVMAPSRLFIRAGRAGVPASLGETASRHARPSPVSWSECRTPGVISRARRSISLAMPLRRWSKATSTLSTLVWRSANSGLSRAHSLSPGSYHERRPICLPPRNALIVWCPLGRSPGSAYGSRGGTCRYSTGSLAGRAFTPTLSLHALPSGVSAWECFRSGTISRARSSMAVARPRRCHCGCTPTSAMVSSENQVR